MPVRPEPARPGPRVGLTVALALLVGAIGLIDYWTGVEISLSIFFLVPIGLAAWHAGPRTGLALAALSAVAWLWADLRGGHTYSHPTIPFWNACVRLGFFVIIAAVLSGRRRSERRILQLAQAKSEFASTVSHELRTPLTCIKEGIAIVADGSVGPLSPEQAEHLGTAQRNVERLSRLLDNVLDFQKIEAGRMALALRDCDVGQLVTCAVEDFQLPARKKGLELEARLDPALPHARCDPDRISQVLANLLHNAVKYADSGTIRVTAQAQGGSLRVAVTDQGPGIRPEDRPRLFQDFTRLDQGLGGSRAGTGLGLVIARTIMTHHGGELDFESQPGQGSTFYLRLPCRPVPPG